MSPASGAIARRQGRGPAGVSARVQAKRLTAAASPCPGVPPWECLFPHSCRYWEFESVAKVTLTGRVAARTHTGLPITSWRRVTLRSVSLRLPPTITLPWFSPLAFLTPPLPPANSHSRTNLPMHQRIGHDRLEVCLHATKILPSTDDHAEDSWAEPRRLTGELQRSSELEGGNTPELWCA